MKKILNLKLIIIFKYYNNKKNELNHIKKEKIANYLFMFICAYTCHRCVFGTRVIGCAILYSAWCINLPTQHL